MNTLIIIGLIVATLAGIGFFVLGLFVLCSCGIGFGKITSEGLIGLASMLIGILIIYFAWSASPISFAWGGV